MWWKEGLQSPLQHYINCKVVIPWPISGKFKFYLLYDATYFFVSGDLRILMQLFSTNFRLELTPVKRLEFSFLKRYLRVSRAHVILLCLFGEGSYKYNVTSQTQNKCLTQLVFPWRKLNTFTLLQSRDYIIQANYKLFISTQFPWRTF